MILVYVINWKKNSTDRHFAIINLFQRAKTRQTASSEISKAALL